MPPLPPFPTRHRVPRHPSHFHSSSMITSVALPAEYPRLDVRANATTASEPSTTNGGISASDLIKEAEQHWNVSADSILAAWALTSFGAILIFLIYSFARNRWKLIYLSRLKIRKPPRSAQELAKEAEDIKALNDKEREVYLKELKAERDKPPYYPVGENEPGRWIARAPRSEMGFLGWLKPTWKETTVEIISALPIWCCCFNTGIGNHDPEKGTSKRKSRPDLFDQDVKLLHMLGLDAMVYILFVRLLRYMFSVIAILAGLLAVSNYYLNTQTSYGSTNTVSTTTDSGNLSRRAKSNSTDTEDSTSVLENLQLLTAANVTSNGLLVHISFEWIVTLIVIVFVLKASAHHLKLVQEWTHMNYNEVSFKTLMITNLAIRRSPHKNILTVADAKREIKSMVLGTEKGKTDASVWFAVHNMNPLYEKIEAFRKTHFSFAIKAVAMETFYGNGKGVFYDSCSGRLCGLTKSAQSRVEEAVKHKSEIEALQTQIRQGQIDVRHTPLKGTITSAFVTVPTATKAREILKMRKKELNEAGYHVQRAPRSHNVLWRNLEQDAKSRHTHAVIGKVALVIICFVNTLPLMVITVLANLGTTVDRWPALAKLEESSDIWKAIITVIAGVLPATISAMFSYLLPYIMRSLSRWSGALTRGQLDKAVIRQLFIFLLVSNFIIFSLLGVLYETYLTISADIGKESWSTIYKSLGDIPAKITRAYISESSYWLSWYPIRSIVVCLQMLQIPRLILKAPQILMIKTPQDLAEAAQPEHFEFAIEYSHILFAMVVGLMYAPLAPIVVICAAIYFWSVYIVHTNQLKYVADSKETDGKCWKIIVHRLLIATVLMQVFMVLTVTLKTRSPVMAVGAALPIGLIFLFKMYLRRHYHPDGELFSQYIDKYQDDDLVHANWAPEYEHELLRTDWMPKVKTVKNEKLMAVAMKRFPQLKELLTVDKKGEGERSKGRSVKKETKKERSARRRKDGR